VGAACSWCRLVVRGIIFTVLDTVYSIYPLLHFPGLRCVALRSRNFLGGKKEEEAALVWLVFHTPSINRSLFFY
jgi:hypothetical protein